MGIFQSNTYLTNDVIYKSYIITFDKERVHFLSDGEDELTLIFDDSIKNQCYTILSELSNNNNAVIDYHDGVIYGICQSDNRELAYMSDKAYPTTFGWILK